MSSAQKALIQILPHLSEKVFDYGSTQDLEKLWSFEDLPADRILIVWSRTAADGELWPIDASACLSPLDWAVAYAHYLGDEPWPEVMVIDASPDAHVKTPSLAHFKTLKAEQLPWLEVVDEPNLAAIATWCGKPPRRDKANDHETAALKRFLREIRLNLTEVRTEGDYDRHSISNIVAPMVLLGKAAKPSRHANALLMLLKACELCGDQEYELQKSEIGKDISILLVDDQADHGWGQWLKTSLEPKQFAYRNDPNVLLDALKKQFKEADEEANKSSADAKAKDLRFRLQLPGIEDASNQVLFLDLRLFSGRPVDEVKFFKALLVLIEERFAENANLAWPGFSSGSDDFNRAREAVEAGTLKADTEEHDEVLTWLPRVIALADMSLPIILFSSTGRRDLVEPFKPYGNIITSFAKPRLSDLTANDETANPLGVATQALIDSLEQTWKVLRARKKAQDIFNLARTIPSVGFAERQRESVHVELYLDEDARATQTNFSVGGVFAVFGSSKEADCFEDISVSCGLRYFEDTLFSPDLQVLDKYKDNGLTQLDSAVRQFAERGHSLELGFVRLCRGDNASLGQPLSNNEEDDRFWRIIEGVIELFCAETLPALKEYYTAKKITFSVYAGTRMVPVGKNEEGDFSYKGNKEIHWFKEGDSQWTGKLRSLGEGDLLPMLTKSSRLHVLSPRCYQLKRAAALALPYECGPKHRLDCLIYRPDHQIFKFDSTQDVEIAALQLPASGCYGRVYRKPVGKDFLFVDVVGLEDEDKRVFCHEKQFVNGEFQTLQRDDVVCLDVEATWNKAKNESGYRAKNVYSATEDALHSWLISNSAIPSSAFLQGREMDKYRPVYRALHYVCDQVMREPSIFSEMLNGKLPGQFDEDFTESFQQALVASRLLDSNEVVGAFKSFMVKSSQSRGSEFPSARSSIAKRLGESLLECQGGTAYSILHEGAWLRTAVASGI